MSHSFKDLFSAQASEYARFRPTYPKELFEFVASLPSQHVRAWDCGTGNGQAALGLVPFFDTIIATDPSQKQIENASPHPKIRYQVEPSEKTSIESVSVDLVTAATAAHWFKLDQFYKEVERVSKPGSWIALWTYGHNRKFDSEIHDIVERYAEETVKKFWAPEIQLVWDQYKTIPFPFQEIQAPCFTITRDFTLSTLIGYLASWSSTQKYTELHGKNPLPAVQLELEKVWGPDTKTYRVTWPVYFRVGQIKPVA